MEPIVENSPHGLLVRLTAAGDSISLAPHHTFAFECGSNIQVELYAEAHNSLRCLAHREGTERSPMSTCEWNLRPNDLRAATIEELVTKYHVALNGRL